MSAYNYYFKLGEMPIRKYKDVSNTGNVVVWTPLTSTRIVLTNLEVASNLGGTIQFYFGGANQIKLAEFSIKASTSISPVLSGWESTAVDAPLYVNASQSGTNG